MIPPGADVNDLAVQLTADGVAYSNPELAANSQLQHEVGANLLPGEGIAVVDVHPAKFADIRDLAQELQDATGLDTVIVQSPLGVSTVSTQYSRAAIEATQATIPVGTDQLSVLSIFHEGINNHSLPWTPVLGTITLATAVIFIVCFTATRRHRALPICPLSDAARQAPGPRPPATRP